MKKTATAIATLVAAASLAGAATVSAHTYPAVHSHFDSAVAGSTVATVRLHSLLETPGTAVEKTIRPSGWGSGVH
jgi:hypothetical protein